MYCENCGKEIDEKAVICPHCGVLIKKDLLEKTKKQPKKQPKEKSEKIKLTVIILYFFAFGLSLFYFLNPPVARSANLKKVEIVKLILLIFGVICAVVGVVLCDKQNKRMLYMGIALLILCGVWFLMSIIDYLSVYREDYYYYIIKIKGA